MLRQALAAGAHPPAAILHAVTDAARVLTSADGTALALRTEGKIVCRARSGEIGPEVGMPLNLESGISGECLRTANVLLCNDAATDDRVDPEVCRALGVRSIVVLPLLGPTGVAGILEAFSSRTNAFAGEQINALRRLAEIAEAAYGRECRGQTLPQNPVVPRPKVSIAPAVLEQHQPYEAEDERPSKRLFWILGGAVAVFLISAVVWLSGREPGLETGATDAPSPSLSTPAQAPNSATPRTVALKPDAGISRHQPDRIQPDRIKTPGILRNAAEIQPAAETRSVFPGGAAAGQSEETARRSAAELSAEPPPVIEVLGSTMPDKLVSLASSAVTVPTLGARVSQGVTEGNLIHRVDPLYPAQARMIRLAGSVIVDARIGPDGSVQETKAVSGPPVLAAAATQAVRQWRYSPPLLNGTPIEIQRRITIVFKLP